MKLLEMQNSICGLDIRLDMCHNTCKYCYANYSNSAESMRGQADTVGKICSAMNNAKPKTMFGYFIKNRYPVCISNHSDVFGVKNQTESRRVVDTVKKMGFPILFETKGCQTDEEINYLLESLSDTDCLYLTIDADTTENLRKIAPNSPSIEQRLKTLDACHDAGKNMIIAINPFMPEINSVENALSLMARYPNAGFWVCPLHLQTGQKIKGFDEHYDLCFDELVMYANEHEMILDGAPDGNIVFAKLGINHLFRKIWPHAKKIVSHDFLDYYFEVQRPFKFEEFVEAKKHLMPMDMMIDISEVYSRKAGKHFRHQLRNTLKSDKISYIQYLRLAWDNPKAFPQWAKYMGTLAFVGSGEERYCFWDEFVNLNKEKNHESEVF